MITVKYKAAVQTRSDLLSLLSEACELEHGLACSYLFSAFTIKQSTEEGLTPEQIQCTRKWAAQIYLVASQEMLHLAQVWNLLKAIGGTPYYFRPNFPQNSKYYSFNVPISLQPFSVEAMQRFLMYELPDHIDEKIFIKERFNISQDFNYKTVGELYRLVKEGLTCIPEQALFIGDPDAQIDSSVVDFPELIRVTDLKTANQAIDMITEQGEGTGSNREDCHYGIFMKIDAELRNMLTAFPGVQPARNSIDNPQAYSRFNSGTRGGNQITNERTREYADLFDDIYNLMLRVLQFVFDNPFSADRLNKLLGAYVIQLMVRIIKPLGEALTFMPQHPDEFSKRSGPGFGLSRHIPFPMDLGITHRLISERHEELTTRIKTLLAAELRPIPLLSAVQKTMSEMSALLGTLSKDQFMINNT